MIREVNLSLYLPDFLKEYKEITATQKTEDVELKLIWEFADKIIRNRFIFTMDETGIKRLEKMLNIQSFASDTLEERRFRILSLWNADTPLTIRKLQYRLDILCGADGYTLAWDSTHIVVRIALKNKKMFNEVKRLLESFVPAAVLIELDLLYNQHFTLGKLRHRDLKQYTQLQVRSEAMNETNRELQF